MLARERMRAEYGNNLYAHDAVQPHDAVTSQRQTNTFRSNIAFSAKGDHPGAVEVGQKARRDRQFTNLPLQPGATRQSYQDSDIFGTKGNSETVQRSAQNLKGVKERQSNTFARSNVIGNDEAALKQRDGALHDAISTRKENNWKSNVFSGPQQNPTNRKNLATGDAGRGGLYGDREGSEAWQKKTNLAGALSKKIPPRPETTTLADERKQKELYGNSNYKPTKRNDGDLMTSAADWRNPQQTYTNKKANISKNLAGRDDPVQHRKERKAQELQSNVLTHQDDEMREARTQDFDKGNSRIAMSSNASWNAQGGYQKPINAGKVNAYKMRQNQLTSNVLEQTDYGEFQPIQKKGVDMNNIMHKNTDKPKGTPNKKPRTDIGSASNSWLMTDTRTQIKDTEGYNQKNQRQNEMKSSLDGHGFERNEPATAPQNDPADEYKATQSYSIPTNKRSTADKQRFLSSTFAGHDAQKYYDKANVPKGEVIDLDVIGLPTTFDNNALKRVANVKHVVSAVVVEDNMKGICTGNGRIKIRLNDGETLDQVRKNYQKEGIMISEHSDDPRKKPKFTGPAKQDTSQSQYLNTKEKKAHELQTKH